MTATHGIPQLQIILNPFHGPATKISNKEFDKRVKALARKLLS